MKIPREFVFWGFFIGLVGLAAFLILPDLARSLKGIF
jgi:hypothetical protein